MIFLSILQCVFRRIKYLIVFSKRKQQVCLLDNELFRRFGIFLLHSWINQTINYLSTFSTIQIYEVLPEETRSFLFERLSRVSLKKSLPKYWRLLENVLTSIGDKFLGDYKEAKRLVASCKAIDDFIDLFGDNEVINFFMIL